jgi:hypothetical protein
LSRRNDIKDGTEQVAILEYRREARILLLSPQELTGEALGDLLGVAPIGVGFTGARATGCCGPVNRLKALETIGKSKHSAPARNTKTTRASALTQTEGSGMAASLSKMAFAGFVQTKGFGDLLCSLM